MTHLQPSPQPPFSKGGSYRAAGLRVPPFAKGGTGGISPRFPSLPQLHKATP